MKNEILKKGGKIHLNCKVLGIKTKNKKAYSILTDKGEYQADIIVSSAPFKEMVCSLGELDKDITDLASKLKFRNTILVYVEADSETKLFEDNWIYVHSPHVQTGRITNFANWTKDLQCGRKENILALEYWANDDEKLWNLSDEELINIAKKDLIDSALLKPQDIKRSFVLKLHKSYPVYERGYKENLNKIYTALDSFSHLYFIGRNGSFKYNNQDHSILMGLACADKILGKAVNLWHINTDYDYQEDSHIPESAANDKR